MKVKVLTIVASSEGVYLPGKEYRIKEEEARQLIAGGYAVPVKEYEIAAVEPEETEAIESESPRKNVSKRKTRK